MSSICAWQMRPARRRRIPDGSSFSSIQWSAATMGLKMGFPFNTYLYAVLSSLIVTLLSAILWRNWCLRVGLVDEPGHRKIHSEPIPLAGGLAVITGLVIPILLATAALFLSTRDGLTATLPREEAAILGANASELLHYGLNRRAVQLGCIFVGAI